MSYSSSLKDQEWEILDPVLKQALPRKRTIGVCACCRALGN
jgi:hypothetical protein